MGWDQIVSILLDNEDEESLNALFNQAEDMIEIDEEKKFYQNYGALYYLLPDEDENINVFDVEGSFFHECLFMIPGMTSDHFQPSYKAGLDSI